MLRRISRRPAYRSERFGRSLSRGYSRRYEEEELEEIEGVECPTSHHPVSSYDKKKLDEFMRLLKKGDEVEMFVDMLHGVFVNTSSDSWVVGKDTKANIKSTVLRAMNEIPESDGLDGDMNIFTISVNGENVFSFCKGGYVAYPISDWGYTKPEVAQRDGVLLCEDDINYMRYDEENVCDYDIWG